MAYKPVPSKDRPPNKSHYSKSSSPSSNGTTEKKSLLSFDQLSNLEFTKRKKEIGKIGDSNYYHRNTQTSGASKYYRASTFLDRKVDPHDPDEADFDRQERKEIRHHERDEASRARRTQAEENSWKTGLIRRESQGLDILGFGYMEGPSRYESIDQIQHSWLELSDHDKAMERQHSAQAHARSMLSISEGHKTHRSWLAGLFNYKNEKARHKANARAGELALARDKARYRHIARENKKAAKRERRRIVLQRGYY